ncbi:uncharacterized protein Triagg1_6475 [Trichoderma aggressivum f. europaeum]|uniref:Uncharacterized protein n=1 Tax=Trichoderma aggressivum f. europaeum TaxID=173218 RepID=A0AAE1IAL7_9HYPO|nr:hypothetical protein Triagg1_6475 [Trichoderma aggressivum f. europaeum]
MSPHVKHHHARAIQELARPIVKAPTDDSSVGEHGCCPITEKILDEIVSHVYDVAKATVPGYDTQALKQRLEVFIKKHYPHSAENDASKSDEETTGEKNAEVVTKVHVHQKIAHEFAAKLEEISGLNGLNVHDVLANKDHFHKLGRHIKRRLERHHEIAGDNIDEADKVAYKHYDTVSENDFSEVSTYDSEETDEPFMEKVDDGATQALRKLVDQVAFEFIIEVVDKREKRKEKKKQNEKYDFGFEGFVKLFDDAANFYTDFDFKSFVKLFKHATNLNTGLNLEDSVELSEITTNFYSDFDLWGIVQLFEYEDGYVMVDRNTMMPSATEITGKAAARTRTWGFFRRD